MEPITSQFVFSFQLQPHKQCIDCKNIKQLAEFTLDAGKCNQCVKNLSKTEEVVGGIQLPEPRKDEGIIHISKDRQTFSTNLYVGDADVSVRDVESTIQGFLLGLGYTMARGEVSIWVAQHDRQMINISWPSKYALTSSDFESLHKELRLLVFIQTEKLDFYRKMINFSN